MLFQVTAMKYDILLLSLFFLISCKGGKTSVSGTDPVPSWEVSFRKNSHGQPLRLSEVFDTVYSIPLQGDSLPVGRVKGLVFQHERFYLWHSNTLSVYDSQGRFVSRIGRVGRAADEYYMLGGFDVNPLNGEISVYDLSSRKIKRYAPNGKWLTSISIPDIIRDFAVLDNGDYIFYTPDFMKGNRRGLWQTDSSAVFKRQWVEIRDDFLYGGLYPKYLQRIDSKTVGLMGGEDKDEIYHISSDTVRTVWHLDVDIKIPKSLQSRPIIHFENYPGKIYTKNNYLETKDLVFLTVSDLKKPQLLFFHKSDGVLWTVDDEKDLIADMPLTTLAYACEDAMMGVMENQEGSLSIVVMKTK